MSAGAAMALWALGALPTAPITLSVDATQFPRALVSARETVPLARSARARSRGVLRAAAPARRSRADGLHERHGAWRHDRRPAFRSHAVRLRAPVLELAMGHDLPERVDHGDASRRTGRALPARARAATRPTTRRRPRTASRRRSASDSLGRSDLSTPSISH